MAFSFLSSVLFGEDDNEDMYADGGDHHNSVGARSRQRRKLAPLVEDSEEEVEVNDDEEEEGAAASAAAAPAAASSSAAPKKKKKTRTVIVNVEKDTEKRVADLYRSAASEFKQFLQDSQPPRVAAVVVAAAVVTSEATCQLRTFMDTLARKLGMDNSDTLVDWSSPAVLALGPHSTDADVLRTMHRGAFAVSRTLFWIQNQECFTGIHIMRDIVTSHEWSARFFEALQLVVAPIRELRSAAEEKEHKDDANSRRVAAPVFARQPRARWELSAQRDQIVHVRALFAQPLLKLTRVEPVAFVLPSSSSVHPLSVTLELAMFRDASKNQNLAHTHRNDAIARVMAADFHLHSPEEASVALVRFSSRQHSLLALTLLLSLDFAPRPTTSVAYAYNRELRAEIVRWMQEFLIHGCACTS